MPEVKVRCCAECDPYTTAGDRYGTCSECGHVAEFLDDDGDPVACNYCWGKWDEFQRKHPEEAEAIEAEEAAQHHAEEMGDNL